MTLVVVSIITLKAFLYKPCYTVVILGVLVQINSLYAWSVGFTYLLQVAPLHCMLVAFYGLEEKRPSPSERMALPADEECVLVSRLDQQL